MVVHCCVFGCNNRKTKESTLSFHTFPIRDQERKQQWIKNICRADSKGKLWRPTQYDRVCSEHFKADDYKDGKLIKCLRDNAAPTVFPMYPEHMQVPQSRKCPAPKERASVSTPAPPLLSTPAPSLPKYNYSDDHSYSHSSVEDLLKKTQKKLYKTEEKLSIEREKYRVIAQKVQRIGHRNSALLDQLKEQKLMSQEGQNAIMENFGEALMPNTENDLKSASTSSKVLAGQFINQKMAFEDERVQVLKQEYLRLYKKYQQLKELARIDLDLLSLCVNLESVPDAKAELDRVHELVHAVMTEEIYHHMDPLDKELHEDDCQVLETDDMNLIENAQNVQTDNMKLIENNPVVKTENVNMVSIDHHMDPFVDDELYEDYCQALETDDMNLSENAKNVETNNMKLIENTPVVKTENVNLVSDVDLESSVNASNPELLAQLTSIFTEQQRMDVFARLLQQSFNKVYDAPRTSEENLPLTHTVQGSHSLELMETSHLDPILESVEGEGEITVTDDIQGDILESSVNASNLELLAQLTSIFTEQQRMDLFARLLQQSFNKVYDAPRTSEEDLPLTHTVQGSHSLELMETSHLDPILESVEGEGEITVADDIQGEHCEDNTSHMVMDPTNDTVMMNQPVVLAPRKTSKQPKKIRSRPPDSQPISLQTLITTGVPNIEKIDDEKKESIATVMPTEQIMCERCGVRLEDRNLFNQHQKIHTEEDNTCTVCGKQFSKKDWLKRHTLLHSSEKPFLCNTCGKRFHTEGYLKKHVERHDNNRPKLYCEVCGKPFAAWNGLSKHRICHSQEKLKCSFCDKQCNNLDALYNHERKHEEHFPHQCSKCGKGFKNPMKLNIHERIHIGESPVFTCSICHKTFSSKVKRNAHKYFYKCQDKLYNCSVCPKQFRGIQAMARHMLTHPEDLQFCILCQQTFDSPSDLQSHVTSTHLVEKLFKCPICGDTFSSNFTLRNHKAYHTNIDPFNCNHCGKSFSSRVYLQVHRNAKHLKTKKYQCEYCGRNFYRPTNFRRHVQTHQGLKPWKCSVCGRGFSQKNNLETHSWTHRADKRYSCESCGRGFNEKRALLSHRKTQHQDQQDNSDMHKP